MSVRPEGSDISQQDDGQDFVHQRFDSWREEQAKQRRVVTDGYVQSLFEPA